MRLRDWRGVIDEDLPRTVIKKHTYVGPRRAYAYDLEKGIDEFAERRRILMRTPLP